MALNNIYCVEQETTFPVTQTTTEFPLLIFYFLSYWFFFIFQNFQHICDQDADGGPSDRGNHETEEKIR